MRLLFAVNPHHETIPIGLGGLPLGHWTQIADPERFEEAGLECALIPHGPQGLELPPLSCGLWVERPLGRQP
jgi:pullulanase